MTEHGEAVRRVCRALLPNVDADDAWSETFLSALRAYPPRDVSGNLRGWLVTIAHRKAIDQLRGSTRRATPVGDLPEISLAAQDLATIDGAELRDALRLLPEKQRYAVVCRYLADLPYDEVAALLNCSQAAARRSVSDGLQSLRRVYAESKDEGTEQ